MLYLVTSVEEDSRQERAHLVEEEPERGSLEKKKQAKCWNCFSLCTTAVLNFKCTRHLMEILSSILASLLFCSSLLAAVAAAAAADAMVVVGEPLGSEKEGDMERVVLWRGEKGKKGKLLHLNFESIGTVCGSLKVQKPLHPLVDLLILGY